MDKGIVIDTKGNLSIKRGQLGGNDTMRGAKIIPTGENTIYIVQNWETAPTSIQITTSYQTSTWVENLTKDGFTIKLGTPPVKDSPLYWLAIW